MALKQGKSFITLAFIFLFALLLGLTVFLTVPPSSEAYADDPIIKYYSNQLQRSYGEDFWGTDAEVIEGKWVLRGEISNGYFNKDTAGSTPGGYFLVYEPYGVREGGEMEKLTDINGKITAQPGTYTLSGASDNYRAHDYADIYEANGNELGNKVYEYVEFTQNPTYVVLKRNVTINVDQSQGLVRYYGGAAIELNCIITAGNMFGDDLSVTFGSEGNLSGAGVGEYDIILESLTITNGGLDKRGYYNITYAENRPKLVVEKYEIKVIGKGDIVDFYRYDGDHYEAFGADDDDYEAVGAYEDIWGINDEKVRIFYMLDEANIERINGALPVSGEGEGYPTLVDYDRIKVYDANGDIVDHKANYEINSSDNNTRLVINKRPLTLFSGSGTPDEKENELYIDSEFISETYGYIFDGEFDRDIEVYSENITFRLAFSEYYAMPEAGEWGLVLINANNPWYDISLDESFTFVIEQYVLKLFDYTGGEGDTKYIAIDYGVGLSEYNVIIHVAEPFEEVPVTLYSEVNETSIPGVHEFASYLESRNFIIDYTGVKILIARKPISVAVQSPRAGVDYGDEYSLVLQGLVDGFDAVIATLYSPGSEFKAGTATAGLPINAGTYKIHCTIDSVAMEFYTLGEDEFADVSLNIARRNIIVRYDLNYSTKEYGSAIALPALGTLSNVYEGDPEQSGLINGDTLSGTIVCGGLIESAAAGTYVVNTSNLSNPNYNLLGGVKVYYNGVLTTSITVNKLAAANLPPFAAELSSGTTTSVTLKNISIQGKAVGSFAISANGGASYGAYQTANKFTGLASGKKYYFKVRIKGDSNIEQGPESAPLIVATALAVPTVKSAASTVDSLTLELNQLTSTAITYSCRFSLNDGAWQDSGEFEGLLPGTKYQISFKCVSADDIESAVGSTYIWTYSAAPAIIIEELPVEVEADRISLSGLEDIYEFRIGINAEGEDVEFSDWSSASNFSGLEQLTTYVIEIRIKASADNGNLSGESASFLLSTSERIIVEEPISYEGIMEYVAKYFIVALMGFIFVLMLIFIVGFTSKFKII